MNLFLVKDGIKGIGCKTDLQENQILNTNFYLLTYDFRSNEGYIEKQQNNTWKVYTQIGQKLSESRYHTANNLEECIVILKKLKNDNRIVICHCTYV